MNRENKVKSTVNDLDKPHLHIVYSSYLSRRKMVHYVSVLTSIALTVFPKRITIHSCSFLIY